MKLQRCQTKCLKLFVTTSSMTLDKVTLVLNFLHKFVFYHFQDKPINLTVEIIRTAIIEINTKKVHILGINF